MFVELHFITTKKKECSRTYIHNVRISWKKAVHKNMPGRAHESPSSHSYPCHCQRTLRLVQTTQVAGGGVMVLSDLAFTAGVHADEHGNEYALTSLSLVL